MTGAKILFGLSDKITTPKEVMNAIRGLVPSTPVLYTKVKKLKKEKQQHENQGKSEKNIKKFYDSWEWSRLRYDFLINKDRRCQCCGAQAVDGVRIIVDHIKPIRKYWKLRLDKTNLQILCDACNKGKGSRDETDWVSINEAMLAARVR